MAADAEPDARPLPAELLHAIHVAFASDPPRRSELFAPGADDGDAADIRRKLRDRRWTAAPRELPVEERSGLSWFSDVARRHYLPLWLLASGHDGLVRLWTVSHLQQVTEKPAAREAFMRSSSVEERCVLLAFLRWIAASFDDVRDLAEAAIPWWAGACDHADS
jgi:hypothetical protein